MASNQANLPSNPFKESRRGNIVVANIAKIEEKKPECDMEELILDTRIDENGEIIDDDLNEFQNQGKKM